MTTWGSAVAALPDVGTGPPPVPGRVDTLFPGLRRLTAPNPGMMTGPGTNSYLVGTAGVAVVDPGPDEPAHLDALAAAAQEERGRLRWILVTHTHPDHAPGARSLAERTGAEVIGFAERDGVTPDRLVGDGWVLEAPGVRLEALHTPGHAADHLCWLVGDPPVLLSGDHVMDGSTVVIRPPDGDMSAYLASLERVLELRPALAAIAPGHGRLIADPVPAVRAIIDHRLERERVVASALRAAGAATVDELLPAVYADVPEDRLPAARFSLWAHLRRLSERGLADPGADPGTDELATRWTARPPARRHRSG